MVLNKERGTLYGVWFPHTTSARLTYIFTAHIVAVWMALGFIALARSASVGGVPLPVHVRRQSVRLRDCDSFG